VPDIAGETGQIDDEILAPAAVADPYTYFGALRERAPVYYNERYSAWVITGYEDVAAGFRGDTLSSDRIRPYVAALPAEERAAQEPTFRMLEHWMVFQDPPDHGRLRRLVRHAFTPPVMARIESRVETVVHELLDSLVGRDRLDLIREVAYPLPAIVIAELLGVPPQDRDRFKRWSDDISALVFSASRDGGRYARAQAGLVDLHDYLGELVDQYRAAPGENLISELVAVEEEGERLTHEELIANCALLLFGGHETTTNLIANGMLALLRAPGETERLRADPGLYPSAVEEVLRYDGPSRMQYRVAAVDHEVGGRTIHAGERVLLVQSAANRDPAVFDDPDRFDVGRDPNRHVGFGMGPHYCLGASLARLEGRVALQALVERLDDPVLEDESGLRWHAAMVIRGLEELPLRVNSIRPRQVAETQAG